jgi:hypothetical protein
MRDTTDKVANLAIPCRQEKINKYTQLCKKENFSRFEEIRNFYTLRLLLKALKFSKFQPKTTCVACGCSKTGTRPIDDSNNTGSNTAAGGQRRGKKRAQNATTSSGAAGAGGGGASILDFCVKTQKKE